MSEHKNDANKSNRRNEDITICSAYSHDTSTSPTTIATDPASTGAAEDGESAFATDDAVHAAVATTLVCVEAAAVANFDWVDC